MPRPRFPIYIVSKGRADNQLTSRALTRLGLPHTIIVEAPELDDYRQHAWPAATVIPLDVTYRTRYELLDDAGLIRSAGSGPARNHAWAHSAAAGHPWHWVMDDNLAMFYRLHNNRTIAVGDGTIFAAMEDFTLRYRNVGMAGPQYYMFAPSKTKIPKPFITNTRIYSCNLIRNDLPYRWRGRLNEDTILSLDMLKGGWCTVLFHAFLQWKSVTQTVKGGNTDEFYAREGTGPKSEMLVRTHPDVARLAWRYHRIHHYVDYSGFTQPLIRRPDAVIPEGEGGYGMTLQRVDLAARKQAEKNRSPQPLASATGT